jgi:divalent metal cation (Fe/Co/Zn/Cd) transporter
MKRGRRGPPLPDAGRQPAPRRVLWACGAGYTPSMRNRSREPFTRADLLAIWAGLACVLAGVLLLTLASGFAAMLVGICLLGVAGIAFVSLAFLLVGESEDRDYGRRMRR